MTFVVDATSAVVLSELLTGCGALIAGRRLFDLTDGWGDHHPSGAPVAVVTRRLPPQDAAKAFPRTVFASSVEEAVARAKEIAADKFVTIASASIIQQALNLDLVDEIAVSQVRCCSGAESAVSVRSSATTWCWRIPSWSRASERSASAIGSAASHWGLGRLRPSSTAILAYRRQDHVRGEAFNA